MTSPGWSPPFPACTTCCPARKWRSVTSRHCTNQPPWPRPDVVHESLLRDARTFQESLKDVVDRERMVYVAGYGHKTVVAVERRRSHFRWQVSRRGDGTVPHYLGQLPDVPTFWAPAKHGSLAKDEAVLRAIDELLEKGITAILPSGPEPPGLRAEDDTEWVEHLVSEDEVDELAAAAERRELLALADVIPVEDPTFEQSAPVNPVQFTFEVTWGDLAKLVAPAVAVGHYEGVYPTAAEAALDKAMSAGVDSDQRILHQATARGALKGALGDTNLFPWPATDGRPSATAIVMGMGRPGTFGFHEHEVLVRNLVWTVERVLAQDALVTVLIGSGADNRGVGETVDSFVQALDVAVREREATGTLTTIRFVEIDLGRARSIQDALVHLAATRGQSALAQIAVAPALAVCEGGVASPESALSDLLAAAKRKGPVTTAEIRREGEPVAMAEAVVRSLSELRPTDVERYEVRLRPSAGGRSTAVPTRLSVLTQGGKLRIAAISDAATVTERPFDIDLDVFEALVAQVELQMTHDLAAAGQLVLRMAVPDVFRPFLRSNRRTIFEVDPVTARLPWELVKLDEPTTGGFLGLSTPVARQLRTTHSPPPSVTGRITLQRMLLIGSPGMPGGGGRLSGAMAEIQAVHDLLSGRVEVDLLVGPDGDRAATRANVISHLIRNEYEVVHYAGHGTFSTDNPQTSGWMLADGLLTGSYLRILERLPPLVVANACDSARFSTGLAGLADDFIGHGVRNLVGTARPVVDTSAAAFAKSFYRTLLAFEETPASSTPASLGAAVLNGRLQLRKEDRSDWDAYQLYGDADFRFYNVAPRTGP